VARAVISGTDLSLEDAPRRGVSPSTLYRLFPAARYVEERRRDSSPCHIADHDAVTLASNAAHAATCHVYADGRVRQYGEPNAGFERFPGQGGRPVFEQWDESQSPVTRSVTHRAFRGWTMARIAA
jgi:hypothetical protein